MMSEKKIGTSLFIFRKDLRLADNIALNQALKHEKTVLVYIFDPHDPTGEAGLLWLHHSLLSLEQSLKNNHLNLIFRQGDFEKEVLKLIDESQCNTIYMNRHSSPFIRRIESEIHQKLENTAIKTEVYDSCFLHRFDDISTGSSTPYKVFTPYYNTVIKLTKRLPVAFARGEAENLSLKSLKLADLGLVSPKDWTKDLIKRWQVGEAHALQKLHSFESRSSSYIKNRDFPFLEDGTSQLSPHLAFGEISPIQIFAHLRNHKVGAAPWLRQIVWRDFAHYLLWHFPYTESKPLRKEFQNFPHQANPKWLKAWQKGQTGFPIVDAGMRELWATGWMHNRVRMIVASFLVKDMPESYEAGEAWFRHTLVDFDEANNIFGWQWSAGCGADAQPYFRIFNPMSQGEKFDNQATYIKSWIPELENIDPVKIHKLDFKAAGTYPTPILDHGQERLKSLEALEKMKSLKS